MASAATPTPTASPTIDVTATDTYGRAAEGGQTLWNAEATDGVPPHLVPIPARS